MKDAHAVALKARRWPGGRRRLPACTASIPLFALLVPVSLFLLASQIPGLFALNEIAYGDSYILYDVQHFQRTGVIYRDLSHPPYLPAQYSPLVYMTYAIPRWNASGNPFFGPRVVSLAAFLLCIAMVLSIVRTLVPIGRAWLWGLLLATSILPMTQWVLQLRGDFPAIFFGLAAVRLLMAKPRPYTLLLAGLSAGLATQFKLLYLAALLAGSLWLLFRKKFREFAIFTAAGAVTSIGLYFVFWLREPRMLPQLLALSPGIPDYRGAIRLLSDALQTPVILLAIPALPLFISRRRPRRMLLVLFVLISFAIATAADIQAGGNINYFFEGLFAVVPLAAFGTLRLLAWSRANAALALFVAALAMRLLLPQVEQGMLSSELTPRLVASRNQALRKTAAALRGQRLFSTVPRLALLDPEPSLLDPFLASYQRQLGKFGMQPILERLRNSQYDVVITANSDTSYRHIHFLDPVIRQAISAAYQPYCTIFDSTLYLPGNRRNGRLLENLREIGCRPIHSAAGAPERTSASPSVSTGTPDRAE